MTGRPRSRTPDFRKAESGLQADETWKPEFPGQRPPFEPGQTLSLKHGSYVSPLKLAPRAQQLADELRPFLLAASPAYETVLSSYSLTLVRVERAAQALEDADARGGDEKLERLGKDLRLWLLASLRFASELGLTPAAQARLFRDAGLGKAASAQAALREHLESRYGEAS